MSYIFVNPYLILLNYYDRYEIGNNFSQICLQNFAVYLSKMYNNKYIKLAVQFSGKLKQLQILITKILG